jgi:hypothetical protein
MMANVLRFSTADGQLAERLRVGAGQHESLSVHLLESTVYFISGMR